MFDPQRRGPVRLREGEGGDGMAQQRRCGRSFGQAFGLCAQFDQQPDRRAASWHVDQSDAANLYQSGAAWRGRCQQRVAIQFKRDPVVADQHAPAVYQGKGEKVRALFDRDALPRREQAIRNTIKKNGFWMR